MSLACFFSLGLSSLSLGLAHPLSWLSFVWCFGICSLIMIIFLHRTPIMGLILHSLFDHWFNFQLDAHFFITKRWKTLFHIYIFFERFALITLSFFLFMELELKVKLRIFCYRWSLDLMTVLFFLTSFILDYWWEFSSHICSHLIVDTFMTLEFSSDIQISYCHPRTTCLHVIWLSFRVLSYVLHPFHLHYKDSV